MSMKKNIKVFIDLDKNSYQVDMTKSWSLAIPVYFNQATEQPNHFDAIPALSKPMQAGSFIGDTKLGGSCNVNELIINPHCNGTHTESIAHICDFTSSADIAKSNAQSLTIDQLALPPLMPCVVISITPELAIKSAESYSPDFSDHDLIISRSALMQALEHYDEPQLKTLVIRTLPNRKSKCQQIYNNNNQPAFFSREAILYLNERSVEHLVVDIPSIDRLFDDGLMTCHHLFWQVEEGTHQVSPSSLFSKTITEMAFIADEVTDDFYFINIQTPAFQNDAAPSRPVLFSTQKMSN